MTYGLQAHDSPPQCFRIHSQKSCGRLPVNEQASINMSELSISESNPKKLTLPLA